MRVAMYYTNSDVRLEEMAKPKPGPGELLVKVMASGICGTDALEWYRVKKAPRVLGHEIAGDVAEVGAGVKRYKTGDRVFVSHHVPCNTCHWCLAGHHTACETLHITNYFPGGFSEYIRVPQINVDRGVFLLPKDISYEEGTFVEPLACVIRGQRIARLAPGQSVLILGSGISGLLHLMMARAAGAGRVTMTDVDAYRLSAASKFGADAAINAYKNVPKELCRVNNGRLAEVVIVCTGAATAFTQALESVDRGGTVLFFASTKPGYELPVPVDKFWRNEITLTTSYANSPADAEEAIELIRARRVPVKKLITHHLALKDANKGFRLVAEAKKSLKVIIEPQK